MHAVVNRLRLKAPIPAEVWSRAQVEVPPLARQVPGFKSLYVVELTEEEVVLVVVGDTAETLDRVATEVGKVVASTED
jgi:hypothetical protein